MDLERALTLVWGDVDDCVYRHATLTQSIIFARDEMTPADLGTTAGEPELHEAYVIVQEADPLELDVVKRKMLDWRGLEA